MQRRIPDIAEMFPDGQDIGEAAWVSRSERPLMTGIVACSASSSMVLVVVTGSSLRTRSGTRLVLCPKSPPPPNLGILCIQKERMAARLRPSTSNEICVRVEDFSKIMARDMHGVCVLPPILALKALRRRKGSHRVSVRHPDGEIFLSSQVLRGRSARSAAPASDVAAVVDIPLFLPMQPVLQYVLLWQVYSAFPTNASAPM